MPKSEATQKSSKSNSPRNSVTVSEENVHRLEEEAFIHDSHRHPHHADHEVLNSRHHNHVAA